MEFFNFLLTGVGEAFGDAYFFEAGIFEDFLGGEVVESNPGVEGVFGREDYELSEGLGGDAFAPMRFVNPIGNVGFGDACLIR